MADEQTAKPEEAKPSRRKQALSGGWNWLKGKRASNALLATIAGTVATGLAMAGIVVPLNDLKRRVGVAESRADPILDHLEAVDDALAAIKNVDPAGAVSALAPQVEELASQLGDIRSSLGDPTTETSTVTTTAVLAAVSVTTATTAPSGLPTVMARLESAEAKLTELAGSLAAEKETNATLATTVASVRSDLATAREELAAVKTLAQTAKATADAVTTRVDAVEPKLPILLTLPDVSIQPDQSAESPVVSATIPATAKYVVIFQAAPNNTDRCKTFFMKHNGGNYASADAAGLDAKLTVRTMQLAAGNHTFAATYYAAPAGGNNAPCVVVSPLFWLQKL